VRRVQSNSQGLSPSLQHVRDGVMITRLLPVRRVADLLSSAELKLFVARAFISLVSSPSSKNMSIFVFVLSAPGSNFELKKEYFRSFVDATNFSILDDSMRLESLI
jgi:hypothetical protein